MYSVRSATVRFGATMALDDVTVVAVYRRAT